MEDERPRPAAGTTERGRIAVGFDGSPAARAALDWTVREAARLGARVLLVTAWPADDRAAARRSGRLVAARQRLQRDQREAVAAATAGLDPVPMVLRQLVLGDPVTALSHAAAFADLVVLGDSGPCPAHGARPRTATALTARLANRAGAPVPVLTAPPVPTATPARPEATEPPPS
nr:universal stress protein [Micromonospora sp. DSM 115978]